MKHVLVLPSMHNTLWDNSGSIFTEQALIMSQLAGWKINILIPQARSILQVKRRGLPMVRGVEIETVDNIEIWRGYFMYYLWRKNRQAWRHFGEQLFLQYVKKHGMPDLLWVHAIPNAGYLAQYLNQKYGIPYFIHEHLTMYHRQKLSFFVRARTKNIINNSVYCAAVSEPLRLAILKQVNVDENKISVVHNPVELEFTSSTFERTSKTPFIFVSICSFRTHKNVDSIIRALAALRAEKLDVQLRIVGDGVNREKLKSLVVELNLQNAVKFFGKQNREQVREHLQNSNAFVAASEYETFGVSLVEALACGLPAVTARVGIAEHVIDHESGALADSTAPADIAKAMRIVLNGNYNHAHIHEKAMAVSHPQVFADSVKERLGL